MKKIILTILSLALVVSFSFADKVEASGWEFAGYFPENFIINQHIENVSSRIVGLHLERIDTRRGGASLIDSHRNSVSTIKRYVDRTTGHAINISNAIGFEPNNFESFQGNFNKYVTVSGNQVPLTVRGEGAIVVTLSYQNGGFTIYGTLRKVLTSDFKTYYWPIPAGKKVSMISINLQNNYQTNHAYVEIKEQSDRLKPLLEQ
ncbi:MAG: hypothetical protein K9L98_01470 [Candidatus Pacebacteria bacterium]|nr:hypothetical protein [Candidatus Paceibacterota bacterium]MCF7862662.1 hypothetical protein [Candidatus Paceibacterota bacterium]